MSDQAPMPELGRTQMQALSLWQPWATLIAIGAKTIETRSWGTRYRGRIAIHAAKTTKGIDALPGDCEGKTEGGWVYGYIGDYQASYCRRTSKEGTRGDTQLVNVTSGEGIEIDTTLPLGAVVATARLVDCLQVTRGTDCAGRPWLEGGPFSVDLDQLPYGDFAPRRWAWMLDDIRPIDPPIPARGKQQLFLVDLPMVRSSDDLESTGG